MKTFLFADVIVYAAVAELCSVSWYRKEEEWKVTQQKTDDLELVREYKWIS